jgi:YD repeat-containing protein
MRRKLAVLLVMVFLIVPVGAIAQQGGTTFYSYDANGRLQYVVAPNGAAAGYQYDAAGNFTSITTIPATTLRILGFNPPSGGAGDPVTIFGTGFGNGSGGSGVTAVTFSGVPATIVSSSANSVVATVPGGAPIGSGPIAVTANSVTASSTPSLFTIALRVSIFPPSANVAEQATYPFYATDTIPGDTGVTWSVNGVPGGNSTVGTITGAATGAGRSTGTYTAPNQIPSSVITVTVTSNTNSAAFASAEVAVISNSGAGGIGVLSPAVSVMVGNIQAGSPVVLESSVSVRIGPFAQPLTSYSSAVSVTTGPVITLLSPSTLSAGSVVTSFTIIGQNLGGVTAIAFKNGSGVDSNITAANIVAGSDGNSLTATVTVGSDATPGQDTVVLTAGSLISLGVSNRTGSNTVQIVQ